MQFIDLATQQQRIKENLDGNIQKVLAHGNYIMGPEIKELEAKLAAYVGVRHAVGCASGTDALLMALMALNVGPGDAVFTTPFTFIATAEVISLLGATPVFVDIDPKTYNIDPKKLEQAIAAVKAGDASLHPLPHCGAKPPASSLQKPGIIQKLPGISTGADTAFSPSPSTGEGRGEGETEGQGAGLHPRAVIPVDLFGRPADYDAIDKIARENGLFVIEDAAQSFGAEYKGKKACSFGHIACTSFFPAKPLGCYGDGGMCFTDDADLAAVLDSIRDHGKGSHKYDNARIGINGRLDTLQAAILLAKFAIFPEEVELRNQAAARYTDNLQKSATAIITPYIPVGYKSVWAQYSLLAEDEATRSALMDRLNKNSIPTAIYYPKPLHLQTAFAGLGYKPGAFPISEDAAGRIFSLPMHPYLLQADQIRITDNLS
jgi:dTDP-4-amino-4,6-dideoxygalactose transaminase